MRWLHCVLSVFCRLRVEFTAVEANVDVMSVTSELQRFLSSRDASEDVAASFRAVSPMSRVDDETWFDAAIQHISI